MPDSDSQREGAALRFDKVAHEFVSGTEKVVIVKETHFTLARGERAALIAPSGSGKSTLLHIAALLLVPTRGRVELMGERLDKRSFEKRSSSLRARAIGFVYQFHHLLSEFSALENVALARRLVGFSASEANKKAQELLYRVGLRNRLHHLPSQLSGGERQRVAIARALVNDPPLLLADEPTGNLDPKLRVTVLDLLMDLAADRAVLTATHDPMLARRFKRKLTLRDSQLVPFRE